LTEPDIALEFHKALHLKGWSVFNWPKEYGGPGWTAVQRYIFDTECARYGAPMFNGAGRVMLAPVLMKFGRQDQKDFYLPRIASGEDHWAQGYSEPGAGSDLASLKTKAESDGDHYIVNGQKIWTTQAHKSNRIFALVRTSNEGKRQEGITFLLIDMDTLGITVRSSALAAITSSTKSSSTMCGFPNPIASAMRTRAGTAPNICWNSSAAAASSRAACARSSPAWSSR
jgi:acyl-CoA dehydrogenase